MRKNIFTSLLATVGLMILSGAPLQAQSTPIANNEVITIATWNLEWFFDADTTDNQSITAQQQSAPSAAEFTWRVQHIAAAIAQFKPTILGLQEIENKKVVDALAAELDATHHLKYDVGFIQGNDPNTEQDVAFLLEQRPGVRTFARAENSGISFSNANKYKIPSKHIAVTMEHATPSHGLQKLTIITTHLKAGQQTADEMQRIRQSRVLHTWAAKMIDDDQAVIIMGDLNAKYRFDQNTATDAMGIMRGLDTTTTTDDLTDVHAELNPADRASHVTGRQFDRILLSPKLLDSDGLVFQSITIGRHFSIRGSGPDGNVGMFTVPQNQRDLTDHFPVITKFKYIP